MGMAVDAPLLWSCPASDAPWPVREASARLNLERRRGTHGAMDDRGIIEAFRAGKPEAFEAIVDLHGDRLFRSAVLLGGSEQVAEDLVQETFLRAFRAASTFRGQSAVFTWLYGILLNVNRKRSRTIFRLIFTDQVPEREAQALVGPALSVDAAATAVLVSEALRQLSVKHREVIVLHYYENMPVDDIARQLRVGSGTVKSRLHYARKHLRSLLPEELNHFA
jgi:RNA polymerase sigma-70 factor (ECF subfamily)